jgi:hypothetical protein
MKRKWTNGLAGFLIAVCTNCYGQTLESGGWFFLTHSQKISPQLELLADVQLRSADRFERLNTLLLRSAVSLAVNDRHALAAGYAYKGDWEETGNETSYQREHRVFEQYLFRKNIKAAEATLRLRLEQRFVREDQIDFSQRGRIFLSAQIPLVPAKEFKKGPYTTLQNELFLNVHHRERVNGHMFDQNRSFFSLGYRWSDQLDTEIGYLHWYQREMDGNYRRNIVQVMVTTSL